VVWRLRCRRFSSRPVTIDLRVEKALKLEKKAMIMAVAIFVDAEANLLIID
jgi:hypothetical protein